MTERRICRTAWGVLAIALAAATPQMARAVTLDEAAAPGKNYAKAEFRLWYPENSGPVRAVVVLVPGSNGDGRPQVDDAVWQAFAVKHRLALVGCRFTDKPHEQGFLEDYANVSQGSGQALLDTLAAFGTKAKHPELATAPLLLWGMSAGGQFNYEFVAWKPERVAAFVVNKGGIYYTALTSRASREVPGILFTGGKDLESRRSTITGLFAVNRRAGALWAIAEEPGAAHIVGRSRDVALIFYEDVLSLRLEGGEGAAGSLKPLTEKGGFLGDPHLKTVQAVGAAASPEYPTAWLPTMRVAQAWRAMVSDQPFER